MFAQGGVKLIASGGKIGERSSQFSERFFRTGKRRFGGGNAGIGAIEPGIGFARELAKRCFFGVEPAEGGFGVVGKRAFPRQIGGELLDATVKFGDPVLRARLFAIECFASDQKALQGRSGLRFGLAQSGQRGRSMGLPRRSLGLLAHLRRHAADRFVLAAPGFLDFAARGSPAQMKQQRFGPAHLRRNVAIAHRLAGLGL